MLDIIQACNVYIYIYTKNILIFPQITLKNDETSFEIQIKNCQSQRQLFLPTRRKK
jgi:hypothetical protein